MKAQDRQVVQGLVDGDERAFVDLVGRYQERLLRFARIYVPSSELAEEAVQETWMAVLRGIERFEGRSKLESWIFGILINRARALGRRESRYVSFAADFDSTRDPGEPAVDPERFFQVDDPALNGHWSRVPSGWGRDPEAQLLTKEALDLIQRAIADLPPSQREVVTLRDVEGWSSREVCNVLEISETNQRVLLHRARSRLRNALEQYFGSG